MKNAAAAAATAVVARERARTVVLGRVDANELLAAIAQVGVTHRGALLLEKLDHGVLVVVRGLRQRSAAPAIAELKVGAGFDEELDDLELAVGGGNVQSRALVVVDRVELGAGAREAADRVDVAARCRIAQGRGDLTGVANVLCARGGGGLAAVSHERERESERHRYAKDVLHRRHAAPRRWRRARW